MEGTRPYEIVVAEAYDAPALARLQKVGNVHVLSDSGPESLVAAVSRADALLVRAKAHITARIIDAAPHLKVIGRASPSVDHIDLRATKRRQISIVYVPHVAVTSTAEFALALILAVQRRIAQLDRQLREGKFDALRVPCGHEMANLTLGLLGVDPVAEALGRICSAAFNMPICYHDPAGRTPTDFKGKSVDFDRLLSDSDIVSMHLPSTSPETKGLLNASCFEKMKPTAIVVNTCRGNIINTLDLAQALRRKTIGGAALDVFESEPLPMDHPLRSCPNCILTPHVAGCTLDASSDRFNVADDVIRVLQGEAPQYLYEQPDEKS